METMDSRHSKTRMNVEGDRISNLPDDLIHKFLSYIGIKQAIETSGLSSRWRYTWTSMPSLKFSSKEFQTLRDFSKFVTHVLSRRNNQTEVSSVELTFHEKVSLMIIKRVLNYASSHNIQKLNITYLSKKKFKVFLPVFRSESLKTLTLIGCIDGCFFASPLTWELPALTTLDLHFVTLCYDNIDKRARLFSNCANLKNLTLKACKMTGCDVFNICHPGLSSITIEGGSKRVNVVAPQLKNLAISRWSGIHLISAPNLSSLRYTDARNLMKLSTDLLHLEKVDICIFFPYVDVKAIVRLFQQIRSVKFLTLNLEIIKLLSSSVELISHQPSPFDNLKSLKIYPSFVALSDEPQPKVSISTEVKNYLLDSSPDATLTIVSQEEMKALKNEALPQNPRGQLQAVLDL